MFSTGILGSRSWAMTTSQKTPSVTASCAVKKRIGGTSSTRLITTCRLQLQSVPPDNDQLNVSVDGTLVPAGADGWRLDTSTMPPTVVLEGATCAKVQMNGASSVQIVYGCPTIIIK